MNDGRTEPDVIESVDRSVSEDEHLLAEAERIAVAVGKMFPGLCEVVLHDLRHPEHAIRVIENNLSGRQVGGSATELGLAGIATPDTQRHPELPEPVPRRSTGQEHVDRDQELRRPLCGGPVSQP